MAKPKYPKEFLELCASVTGKRPKTVIDHLLKHGHITTEEWKNKYGYDHPPRAARDVRELGIQLVTFRVEAANGRKIAAYRFADPTKRETLIQSVDGTYQRVSALRVWGQRIGFGLIVVLMLSSPLFALIWGVKKSWGKLPNAGPLSVRILPLLSTLSLGAMMGLIYYNWEDRWTLGVCSTVTVGIMLASLALAATAAASVFVVYREKSAAMNRLAYWHSVLVAVAAAVTASYLGYWGWIGLRLWA